MRKTITINGTEYKFKSSAAIPRIYRLKFGRDIFVDMQKIEKQIKIQEKLKDEMQKKCAKEGTEFDESKFESGIPIESLERFENIAFLMHKHGDPDHPDVINEWLYQFEPSDIYVILPEVMEMWKSENKQMSVPKKREGNRS